MKLINKNLIYKILVSVFTFSSIFINSGCVSVAPVYYEDDKKTAQKKVEEFHQYYNDKNFKEMYKLMSAETQKVLSEEMFVQKFEKTYTDLGKIIKSDSVKSDVKPQAASRLVTFIYETEFQNGKLEEKFVCSTDGKQAFIEIYDQPNKVRSKASQ